MAWSYKILSVFDIDIELHISFLLFILLLLVLNVSFAFLILLVFIYVTLHELSHSYVALKNKINVKSITLLPIGGMSMIDTKDISPYTELKVSIAGPLFNFVMVYILLGLSVLFNWPLNEWLSAFVHGGISSLSVFELFIFYSLYSNLILGSFNLLLPAFPLDGGRIFRALLAYKLDYKRATEVAKNVSIMISIGLFLWALLRFDVWIMLISLFIIFGASAEYQGLLVTDALSRAKLLDIIELKPTVVKESHGLQAVINLMLKKRRTSFITDKMRTVSLRDIYQLRKKDQKTMHVNDVSKPIAPVSSTTDLNRVMETMANQNTAVLPVMHGKKLVGVVYQEDIDKYVRMKELLE
ncbi:MAG: site-2 protease family protein [DPANN group archaeon]|nr:site-2 protease family protein [DPANN group archaeon]